ncbi:transaldolase family protein [Kitasatospora purpeofusca]|uniref:transaldolase family protein n=1 Tax=Kitasatospora purpeofusca TaxID=67352 RepID=UPI00068A8471|nr:transaldolase family protein [Kitasatospora purpeofusca]
MKKPPAADPRTGDLRPLIAEGVSPWLDGINRGLVTSGLLGRLIDRTGLRGATTNPALLTGPMRHDPVYAEQLARLAEHHVSPEGSVWAATVHDLRLVCEEFLGVHRATHGHDGLVSADLDPRLAHDAAATVAEAVELARAVDRPNLLVKIPATAAGLTAIRDCVGRGLGVHATGLYSVRRYGQVVDAYFDGLEQALAAGLPLAAIASVASLPVGRVDREIDRRLAATAGPDAAALRGLTAQAAARLMYRAYEERLGDGRWRTLRASGARPQRLLWTDSALGGAAAQARYVAGLVSWGTAHAMTRPVLDEAVRKLRLEGDTLLGQYEAARAVLDRLGRLGIDYGAVARRLEEQSVPLLVDHWLRLHAAVEGRPAARPGDQEPARLPLR